MVGSIVEYLFAPDDPEAVIEKMAAESTRIVSLTITEGGYNISDVTGEFDVTNPDVIRDLEPGARSADRVRPDHRGAAAPPEAQGCRRSRSCPATTCRATVISPGACSRHSRGCGTPDLATGSSARCASPTRWSTASRR